MSRLLHFSYDILLEFSQPVREHDFALRCIPSSFPGQDILECTLSFDPQVPYTIQRDGFGNLLQIGRIPQLHDHFRYTLNGTARLAVSQREPERPMTVFRFPSDYTQPWQGLTELLEKWDLPANPQERAWQLMTLVHEHMEYAPGTTGVNTTAEQAFASGKGVCQDYAHIYLAMARQAGLTARYVNGLPEGEGVSHAWCEVWLDGIWTGIDPTRCQWTDDGYIRFGVGRDFGDCPIERGVFRGGVNQTQTIFMRVWEQ